MNEFDLHLFMEGRFRTLKIPAKYYSGSTIAKGSLLSPMPGKIIKILVESGQTVEKGKPLMIMEAMKMEVFIIIIIIILLLLLLLFVSFCNWIVFRLTTLLIFCFNFFIVILSFFLFFFDFFFFLFF
jgi:hypothetical protein